MQSLFALLALASMAQSELTVSQPVRLALTPLLDGKLSADEWDPLLVNDGITANMQWEPGILYVSAKAPADKDVVVSLDMAGDGWLVGRDNLELKLHKDGDSVKISMRTLDATDRQGPQWIDSPVLTDQVFAALGADGDDWVVELKMIGLGLYKIDAGTKIGIRCDAGTDAPASTPRSTSLVHLQWDRGIGLPAGVEWNSQYKARSAVPGEAIAVRYNLKGGTTNFERADMRLIGVPNTATVGIPCPEWDKRKRFFVDYKTDIPEGSAIGYRVAEAKFSKGDHTTITQTSLRVADTVVFDVNLPEDVKYKEGSQIIRGGVYIRSQTMKRIGGEFELAVPADWTANKGKSSKFNIYFSRGSARIPLELITPQKAKGVFPLKFKATIGGKVVETTYLLAIR